MTPEAAGPHGRLGVVWAVITVVVAAAGPAWLAAWLALHGGLAAAQVARWRSRRPRQTVMAMSGLGATAVTLAALGGPSSLALCAGGVVVAALACALWKQGRTRDLLLASLVAVAIGGVAAAPVLLRATGLAPVLVLFAYAMAYDASTYVVGSGAANAWEGPAAGIAATGTVTLTVAALLVPPFRGASPWVLGALAAGLAPLGPLAASALLGDSTSRAPALRRLDSLLVLAPVWAVAVWLLLD